MSEPSIRDLEASRQTVRCTPNKREFLDRCRFCVHSTHFKENGVWVDSPARAYCMRQRATTEVNLSRVTMVRCDDLRGEGFRSIMTIIS